MISRDNPYVGPRAFRTGERLYGRDRELKDLVDLLVAERIVLLYSPSGAGKLFRNRFDVWPGELRAQWRYHKDYLNYGVASLHHLKQQKRIFVLHRHGPPLLIDLSEGLADARAAYLLPDDLSAERLRVARAGGRATRQASSPEQLVAAAVSRDGVRIAVGGQRSTTGWWHLGRLSLDSNEMVAVSTPMAANCAEPTSDADGSAMATVSGCVLYAGYRQLPGLGGAVRALRFIAQRGGASAETRADAPADTWLWAADWEGNLRWWSISGFDGSGHRSYRPEAAGAIYGMAFLDPAGGRLAVGDYNGVIATWKVQGEELVFERMVQAHRDAVLTLVYSENGRLVSGGADGVVFLWEAGVPDLTERSRLRGPRAEVESVAISEQGRLLAAGTTDGWIHLWELDLDKIVEQACASMFRNLDWQEWQRYVGKARYQCTCSNLPPGPGVPPDRIDRTTCPSGLD